VADFEMSTMLEPNLFLSHVAETGYCIELVNKILSKDDTWQGDDSEAQTTGIY
jgi:hypothetical protein